MVSAPVGAPMSDRSDELTETREPGSTDELLEETDRLLSESGARVDDPADAPASGPPSDDASPVADSELGPRSSDADADSSRFGRLTDRLPSLSPRSPGAYFSPKAFAALALALGVGLFVGDAVVPFAGRAIGAFAVAFLVGLATSRRRYLETAAAGLAAGGVTTLVTDLPLAIAGSGRTLLLVGAAFGLVASVLGYYFGRDLRNGLLQDVE